MGLTSFGQVGLISDPHINFQKSQKKYKWRKSRPFALILYYTVFWSEKPQKCQTDSIYPKDTYKQ